VRFSARWQRGCASARVIADALSKAFGQPVLIDNKPAEGNSVPRRRRVPSRTATDPGARQHREPLQEPRVRSKESRGASLVLVAIILANAMREA
jgi:Tripartite tricarboxylate transporter family receptor